MAEPAPPAVAPRPGSLRRPAWRLGLLLAASYAYFMPKPAWNEISRFDLVRALVERRSVNIDPDHPNTEDKARLGAHHYSDKAPGASLLAVPAYVGYLGWLKLRGAPRPQWLFEWQLHHPGQQMPPAPAGAHRPVVFNDAFLRAVYVCNLFTGVPAGAACGVLLFLLLARGGVAPDRALAATLALALGSPFYAYSTMFFGHVLAGSFLLAAFVVLTGSRPGLSARRLVATGALLGLAVLTELPAALGAAVLVVYAFTRLGAERRLPGLAWLAAGALPPVALLAAYQTAAFGHPLRTGYAHVVYPLFAEGMAQGWFGISWPRPAALLGLLLGRSRGLLYLAPVMALGFVGLARGLGKGPRSPRAAPLWPALAIVIVLALLNAGYYMWWGGAALGPRHLVPALPFLALGIPLAIGRPRVWWAVAGPLLVISIVNQLVVLAVDPLVPFGPDVLLQHAYPHLVSGRIAVLPGSSNVGLALGLPGLVSLLPLLALWAVGILSIVRSLPDRQAAAA